MKQKKSKTHFHFKKFSVSHEHSTMKVGTDTVLLGAWANVDQASNILEIGTGNGTIALMLAQRTPDHVIIDAVEIEESDAGQAAKNFLKSPWASRINLHHTPVQQFQPQKKYDAIVTNPPYFNNSQSPSDPKRYQARHTITLSYEELLASTLHLLQDEGRMSIILPYVEGFQFKELANENGFCCTRQYSFRTRQEKSIERWLMEFSRITAEPETGEILLYKEGEEWADSYKALTRDFYLKL
jgi:tRNA1Val (adenine37-N6)-methyltransferase